MKNLTDILNLITEQTNLNEGKALKYQFSVDTEYKMISMKTHFPHPTDGNKDLTKWYLTSESYSDFEGGVDENKIQLIYWTIKANCR